MPIGTRIQSAALAHLGGRLQLRRTILIDRSQRRIAEGQRPSRQDVAIGDVDRKHLPTLRRIRRGDIQARRIRVQIDHRRPQDADRKIGIERRDRGGQSPAPQNPPAHRRPVDRVHEAVAGPRVDHLALSPADRDRVDIKGRSVKVGRISDAVDDHRIELRRIPDRSEPSARDSGRSEYSFVCDPARPLRIAVKRQNIVLRKGARGPQRGPQPGHQPHVYSSSFNRKSRCHSAASNCCR